MIDPIVDSFDSSFFRLALIEAVFAGVVGGVLGVQVMLRRLPMYVLALSHATFPGVVLAAIVGVSVTLGAVMAGVAVALVLYAWGMTKLVDSAGLTGVLLSGSFAIGVVLAALGDVSNADMVGYLVGSILTVQATDVIVAGVGAVLVVVMTLITGRQMSFSVFDRNGARAAGLPVGALDVTALVAVALGVVVMIPAVGTLLALGLMTVPAMSARLICERLGTLTFVSAAFGAVGASMGVLLSAVVDIAVSGLISLCLIAIFCGASVVRVLRVQMSRRSMRISEPSARPRIASEA